MRVTARRINDGQALRDAMAAADGGAGIGMQELANRTRHLDPAGKGVSLALIGFLTQPKEGHRHARETCSVESADLIERTLETPWDRAAGRPAPRPAGPVHQQHHARALFDRVEAPGRNDPQPAWEELGNVSAQ